MKALITVGPTSSGKSIYAAELVASGWREVNRDNIRFALFPQHIVEGKSFWEGYAFTQENEERVTALYVEQIKKAARDGCPVILSDTFLNPVYRKKWREVLRDNGYNSISFVYEIFSTVSLETLHRRNDKRQHKLKKEIVDLQYQQFQQFLKEVRGEEK